MARVSKKHLKYTICITSRGIALKLFVVTYLYMKSSVLKHKTNKQ